MNFHCWLIVSREIEINFRAKKKREKEIRWLILLLLLLFFSKCISVQRKLCMLANKAKTFPFQWTLEIRDLSAMWLIVKTLKSVLFYFPSFSISLMVVDFSKWKKEECELCFKHTVCSCYVRYTTNIHRVVACAYFVNQCHYHPTVCFCCVLLCVLCMSVYVYRLNCLFFLCENDEKRVRAQISVRMSVMIEQNTHLYYNVHKLCLPIDAWIKFQNKTIRYERARIIKSRQIWWNATLRAKSTDTFRHGATRHWKSLL